MAVCAVITFMALNDDSFCVELYGRMGRSAEIGCVSCLLFGVPGVNRKRLQIAKSSRIAVE